MVEALEGVPQSAADDKCPPPRGSAFLTHRKNGGRPNVRLPEGFRPKTDPRDPRAMKPDEVAKLILDIERSVQMRTMLRQKLASNQEVDLVEEWNEIEQLDLEIARKIRKRPIE